MQLIQAARSPWTWLAILGLLLVLLGITGRFGAFVGAVFTPDALIVGDSATDVQFRVDASGALGYPWVWNPVNVAAGQ